MGLSKGFPFGMCVIGYFCRGLGTFQLYFVDLIRALEILMVQL